MRAAASSQLAPGHGARRPVGFAWSGPLAATASRRLAAVGARLRRNRRRVLSGAARGMLGSPWFAAGAGFVIAATAFIVAPRAEARFPHSNAISVTQCTQRECKAVVPQGAVVAPLGGSSDQIVPPTPAAAAVIVGYQVLWQQHGTFLIQITLASKQAAGNWQLAFTIPGAVITSVTGADSQRTASGLVTVSGSGSGGQGHIKIFVIGQGSVPTPQGCELTGAQCHFSLSS